MKYYISVLKNYFTFSGRSSRKEYWMFILINVVISIIIGIVGSIVGDKYSIISVLYILVMIIPTLAVDVRRLHDTGKSAWWLLINFVPFIGSIWFIVLMVLDSNLGENKYGKNPKEIIII